MNYGINSNFEKLLILIRITKFFCLSHEAYARFSVDFAICPQWGASLSCSGQADPFSTCSLPAILFLPIRGGGEEPHGSVGCVTFWCIHAAPAVLILSHVRTGCTGADRWSVQPSKWSLTVAISRHRGKSNKRAIMYTFLILSKSPAVFSSEISWPCCYVFSSLLWILLLIASAVFPWALWIAPTLSFVIGINCLMHGTTSFCLFWAWFLLPYWIACILSKAL